MERAAAASLLAQNPKLVQMIQGRLGSLIGQSSGYIESLPAPVRRRVSGLRAIQKDHAKLEAEFQEEVLQLEKKYFAKFTPLYEKRAAIVNGKVEPTEEEVKRGDEDEEESNQEQAEPAGEASQPTDEVAENVKGIPEFWLSAMKNQVTLAEMITDRDEAALKHLVDIRMEYLDKPGFRLIFEFEENEFFSDKIITKTYYYQNESGYGGDFIYDHAEGHKIDWYPGKDLTVRIEAKKQRNKSEFDNLINGWCLIDPDANKYAIDTKQTRIVKKSVPTESFFNFFSPPKPPTDDDDENDDVASDIEERLELDYQLGEDIKEKLIPRAVDWFTGEALAYEEFDEDDMEAGDFEDDEDDEDDMSEDHDDDEESDEDVSFFFSCAYAIATSRDGTNG
jgi:nucleosome assembly protein 1-like 1